MVIALKDLKGRQMDYGRFRFSWTISENEENAYFVWIYKENVSIPVMQRLFRSAFRHRADNAAPSPAGCGFAACARFHCVALHDDDALRGAGDGLFRAESRPAAPSG